MELYTRLQPLLFDVLLVAIAIMFIISIFKRDFVRFLVNLLLCSLAALFIKKPSLFISFLDFIINFAMELLGKGV